jgi:SAM-dependent methyltransferase
MDSGKPEMTDLDPSKPNIARLYDALRDGKDNFEADREAADAIQKMAADAKKNARENRAFHGRAVRFLAGDAGIGQFLDIGSGMPADDNTHEIAQRFSPSSRVAYLDNDPVVLCHARAVLAHESASIARAGDLRNPGEFLDDPALRDFIDFSRPVGVLLLAVLHFIEDPHARDAVDVLMRELPRGSYLVISHASADEATAEEIATVTEIYKKMGSPIHLRSRDEITSFFGGLEMVPPGVVNVGEWQNPAYEPARAIGYVGVARKAG